MAEASSGRSEPPRFWFEILPRERIEADGALAAERSAMKTTKVVHVVRRHAEGEVGDVIVGGAAPPPGAAIWDQARFIASDETLRSFVLNEARGGAFRHVNLLVPPKHPRAHTGWIIMEPCDTPPMSGSNSMCVAIVLLETGVVPMREPRTKLALEPPGGYRLSDTWPAD